MSGQRFLSGANLRFGSFAILAGLMVPVSAQNRPQSASSAFRPVQEAPAAGPRTGEKGSWSLSVAFSSSVPFSSPFEVSGTSLPTQKFRFQTPVTFGIGVMYGWSDVLDLGLEVGLEDFDTKVQYSPSSQDLEMASFTSYPIRLIARYRFGGTQTITPEVEAGVGYALGKSRIHSTIVGSKSFKQDLGYLTGHAGAGVAVAWNEETTLHAQIGAAFSALGSKKFNDTSTNAVITQSSLFGLFVRAGLSYRF